ncbi:MAG: hypothetical protein ACOVOR_05110 [Rhabdochlamydiaceae bacterium]
MNKDELLLLNQKGIFPAPLEDLTAFQKRVFILLDHQLVDVEGTEESFKDLKEHYDIDPDWLSITKKKAFSFLKGAETLYEKDRPKIFLYRRPFSNSLYQEKELLTHEAVHACRYAFPDSEFEEILAYRTSLKNYRRYIGPFFSLWWESLFWVILLCIYYTISIYHLFYEQPLLYVTSSLTILFIFVFYTFRLMARQLIFKKARKHLSSFLKKTTNADPCLLRMTDKEIRLFQKEKNIKPYIEKQTELRWQIIKWAYLKEDI